MMDWVDELHSEGGWRQSGISLAEEDPKPLLSPEDCVSSTYSTATRSICRALVGQDGDDAEEYLDTDTTEDWHVVPTGGQSFGRPNDPSVHAP